MDPRGYFIGRLLLEPVADVWMTREEFIYVTEYDWRIWIPENFISDGCSIPRAFWSFCNPMDPRVLGGAVVHDYLYAEHWVSQIVADTILAQAVVGCSDLERDLIYNAVHRFGEDAYRTGPERQKAQRKRLAAMGLT